MAVSSDETVVEFNHYTRGYHDYIDVWTPTIGETLYLHCEPDNPKDSLAVAIVTGEDVLVGHVPELFNRQLYYFLQRDGHSGSCEVTGERTNRGIGVGLEIPCKYRLRGKNIYVKKLSSIINKLVVKI